MTFLGSKMPFSGVPRAQPIVFFVRYILIFAVLGTLLSAVSISGMIVLTAHWGWHSISSPRVGFAASPPPPVNQECQRAENQGAVKEVYLKGLFAQGRLSYREMDCPVRFHREMDWPVQWSLATPSALESQSRANQGSVVANPICKCRRHKAGHLQVRVAVGKRSTCVLKEAPLNKGPLGLPQRIIHAQYDWRTQEGCGLRVPNSEKRLIRLTF